MPTITIHLTTPIPATFRAAQVAGMFDLPLDELQVRFAHTLTAEVPGLDEDWTIGAIVGPSGSGKTTLARAAFGAIYDPPPWPEGVPIIECLERSEVREQRSGRASSLTSDLRPLTSLKHLLRVLTAVGLASPPSWLLPYRLLSTGERFRADLARAVSGARDWGLGAREDSNSSPSPQPLTPSPSPLLVFDEFTSALDRTTACTASASLARLLRERSDAGMKEGESGRGGERETSQATSTSDLPLSHSPPLPLVLMSPEPRTLNPIRFVALSCHTDFLPWLQPDWVLDLSAEQEGERGRAGEGENRERALTARLPLSPSPTLPLFRPSWPRGSLQRPALRLAVRRVPQALWPRFARHHYLSGGLARSATCYAAFDEGSGFRVQGSGKDDGSSALNPEPRTLNPLPVAFCATLATLGHKRTKRISRLVVLPQFQGLGIGARLAETVAEHEAAGGNRVTITASHPAIVAWCWHSPRWRYTGLKKTGSTRQRLAGREIRSSAGRAVASFEFLRRTGF